MLGRYDRALRARQPVGGAPFTPRQLFNGGTIGAWYEPKDLATLFQDSAGTTQVSSNDHPVGFMMDKSAGALRGSNLYTGSNIIGVPIGGPAFTNYPTGITLTTGKTYELIIDVTGYSGTNTYSIGGTFGTDFVGQTVANTGNRGWRFFVTVLRDVALTFFTRSTNTATFGNIRVSHVIGNHSAQGTLLARPLYKTGPSMVFFDGIDDAHTSYFSAVMGSNCTVARAIPGTGAQILTGQTVGATFSNSTTHAGLVIVNRALSVAETQKLTAFLNKAAGV